jgi:GTPase SAR1 family protein
MNNQTSKVIAIPSFAIVGHPNKGKSTLVASLVQNDNIAIEAESGTTLFSQHFNLQVDGHTQVTLIDTPGFQRARKCLAWLNTTSPEVHQRTERLQEFLNSDPIEHRCSDELEVLKPIMDGAGIIYVVDGSVPYSAEYEAEMEILRWSGQPRLALINPIISDEYVEEWTQSLNQYFSNVRVFNPVKDNFDQQLALFSTFALLNNNWQSALERTVTALKNQHQQRLEQAALIMSHLLIEALSFQVSKKYQSEHQSQAWKTQQQDNFYQQLRNLEQKAYLDVERCFMQYQLKKQINLLTIETQDDLFTVDDWYLWGLDKPQLLAVSGGAGAAAGAATDAAVGGASMLLGTVSGGIIGGAMGWWFSRELPQMKVKGLFALGGQHSTIGPIRHINFPFVLLNRVLNHADSIIKRSHGNKNLLALDENTSRFKNLTTLEQASWLKTIKKAVKDGKHSDAANALTQKIKTTLIEQT